MSLEPLTVTGSLTTRDLVARREHFEPLFVLRDSLAPVSTVSLIERDQELLVISGYACPLCSFGSVILTLS